MSTETPSRMETNTQEVIRLPDKCGEWNENDPCGAFESNPENFIESHPATVSLLPAMGNYDFVQRNENDVSCVLDTRAVCDTFRSGNSTECFTTPTTDIFAEQSVAPTTEVHGFQQGNTWDSDNCTHNGGSLMPDVSTNNVACIPPLIWTDVPSGMHSETTSFHEAFDHVEPIMIQPLSDDCDEDEGAKHLH